MAKWCQTASC